MGPHIQNVQLFNFVPNGSEDQIFWQVLVEKFVIRENEYDVHDRLADGDPCLWGGSITVGLLHLVIVNVIHVS